MYETQKQKVREATAYAIGHTEAWLRQFSESVGLPYGEIALGVSRALGDAGQRAAMSVPRLRRKAPGPSKVLQPKVAVVSRAPEGEGQAQPHKRRRISSRAEVNRIKAYRAKHTIVETAEKFNRHPSFVAKHAPGKSS